MTVADDILYEVGRRSGLTEVDLAALLFGRSNGYRQMVNFTCAASLKKDSSKDRAGAAPAIRTYTVSRRSNVGNFRDLYQTLSGLQAPCLVKGSRDGRPLFRRANLGHDDSSFAVSHEKRSEM